ncbi:copper amine oxidase N-terminal domain-containing protein [Bacillaceae bacterium SIJ1]|uniref:stalk domain-containing protein n=1 Tax=Litoribacterium kuwaitense TaxID=1398745 RepID=UPI0013ED6EC5|nr:copper amine oxidase N-terminal domain-containing protein [Litoribacterium kuwaitense]
MNHAAWVPQNEEGKEVAPVMIDGTSYLPVKSVIEATGGQVEWDEEKKTIVIKSTGIHFSKREENILQKMEDIKRAIAPGMTQEEVREALDVDLQPVSDNGDVEDGSDSFSGANIFAVPGYKSDLPGHIIDKEGLLNEQLGIDLFIAWKEGQLNFYSLAYVNPVDDQVYLYILRRNGFEEDRPV